MKNQSLLRVLGTELLDLFLPQECLGCGVGRTWLCSSCCARIVVRQDYPCAVCKRPTLSGETHAHCKSSEVPDGLLVATHRSPLISELVHVFKYDRLQELAEIFSQLLLKKIEQSVLGTLLLLNSDIVMVPVPLHRKRQWDRGFNQTELLAQHLSRLSSVQGLTISSETVVRNRATKSQTLLHRDKRKMNITDAFSVVDPDSIKDKTVVIIDDVMTTGATVSELCKVIKKAGAKDIWSLVFTWD